MATLPENEPRRFDHYVVEAIRGRGAMGTVYQARDARIGRRVALKTVRADQLGDDEEAQTEFFQRLQREAELCGSLQHPNIVTLYEVGYEGGRVSYLATEYVEGPSLKNVLQNGKLPPQQAFEIIEEILIGLTFAHEKRIIHRDLKPGNILLNVRGGAKIADFGIARLEGSDLTSTGTIMGTPSYMSPEQAKILSVTPTTDLFSLGVMVYEMLSGERPFQAPNMSTVLYNIVHVEPKPLRTLVPGIGEDEETFVHKLLEKKPKDRYGSAEEALAEVRKIRARQLQQISEVTQSLRHGQILVAWLRRPIPRTIFFATSAALLFIFLLTAAIMIRETRRPITRSIGDQQLEEFVQKELMLANARMLIEEGKYTESVNAFDIYLKRYPYSTAAKEGRREALDALERIESPSRTTRQNQKNTLRDRVRRIFRRN